MRKFVKREAANTEHETEQNYAPIRNKPLLESDFIHNHRSSCGLEPSFGPIGEPKNIVSSKFFYR